ncbi:MAG: MMPL family transporter [Granulosicoccus sp.]
MIERYGNWIVRYRWLVLLLSVAAVVGLMSGARHLVFTNDYRVFFSPDNPQLIAFEELQEAYTKSDNVLIMLEPESGDVFSPEVLAAVVDLTDRAWQIPYSVRVDSLSNFQHMTAEGDDLIVADLVEEPDGLSAEDIELIRVAALDQPLLVKKLLSPSSDVTGVNITVEMPQELSDADRLLPAEERAAKDPAIALQRAVEHTRELVAAMTETYPDIKISTTGLVMMNQAFPEATITDMQTIIPMAFVVILVGILLLIASPIAMIGTVLVVLMSILAAMGTAGWLGIKLTPPSASAPTLILTLAVADCVHFLVTLYHSVRQGMHKHAAIIESLRINFTPILLTSVTTAIGFLSMNFSDAPPFRDLGNITAMGVMYAFVLAVFFLPALMAVLPVRAKVRNNKQGTVMDKLSGFVINKRRPLFWGMLLVMIGLAAMAPRNELNDEFVKYFDESVPFRVETDRVTEKLSGLYLVDFSIESGEEGGVSNPEFLAQVEAFEKYLQAQPEVQHVNVFTETMRRLNRSMHGDDDAYYKLPESRELSAQYLLLYEMSLPYGLDLNNQINFDKSSTRMTVTIETLSTSDVIDFENRTLAWMEQNTPQISTLGTGPTLMFSHIGMRNIKSMLTGTGIALVLISLILIVALRSVKFGLMSLIPNIAPALMAFGVWGMLVGEVGLAVSVVVAMTLGIVVDDTIHFLSKYLRARRERGMNPEQAVQYAFNTVGVALLITTIVLVAGFLVIAQSNFLVNSQMGLLTAITITIALVVDFLFLPPLLLKLDSDEGRVASKGEMPRDAVIHNI